MGNGGSGPVSGPAKSSLGPSGRILLPLDQAQSGYPSSALSSVRTLPLFSLSSTDVFVFLLHGCLSSGFKGAFYIKIPRHVIHTPGFNSYQKLRKGQKRRRGEAEAESQ